MESQVVIDDLLIEDAVIENIDDQGYVKVFAISTNNENMAINVENPITEFGVSVAGNTFVLIRGYGYFSYHKRKKSEFNYSYNGIHSVKIKLFLK